MTAKIQFISAGAGSGKTYTITEALNRALLEENFSPDSIFATTFTKKAAQELLQRVREKVLQTVASDPIKQALALQINQAKIGTLHSLCAIYVERFAFELGLSPKLNIIDEQHAEQMLYEVFEQLADDEVVQYIIERALATGLRFGFGKTGFKGESTTIIDIAVKLVQEARANAIDHSHFKKMAQSSWTAYESLFPIAVSENGEVNLKSYLELAKTTVLNLEQLYAAKNKDFPGWLKKLRNSSFVDPQRFKWSDWENDEGLSGKAVLPFTQSLLSFKARFAECTDFRNDLKQFIEDIFALAEGLAVRYQAEKRKIGYIDFADLEAYFLTIIQNPDYLSAIGSEFAFVLVDEFQDTNPMQLAIYSELFKVARKVTLVGDLKQAIYGFRGASPELMELLINKLRQQGQNITALEYSWRSTAEVLNFSNQLFTKLFDDQQVALNLVDKNNWQVPAEQFLPAVSHWPLLGKNAAEYAKDLCYKLQQLMQKPPLIPANKDVSTPESITMRPLRWRDIVILENSNADIRATVAALQKAGIPAVAEQSGLTEQAEVVLALAALQLVVEPKDTLAQAEFITLYQQDGLTSWLKNVLKPESTLNINETANQVLHELHQARLHFDPAELLSLVMTKLKLADVIVSWDHSAYQSEQRLANLDALLNYAKDYCQLKQAMRLPVNVNGFYNFLKDKSKKDLDLQQGSAGDAVQVMTVHAAKGLEWPMVIANFLDKPKKHRLFSVKALNSAADYQIEQPLKGRVLRFLPSYKASRGTVDKKDSLEKRMLEQDLGALELQHALSEAKRELYVALTRAKHYLVLISLDAEPADFSFYGQFPQLLAGVPSNLTWHAPVNTSSQAPIRWRAISALDRFSRKITPSAMHGGQQLYVVEKMQFGQNLTIPKQVAGNKQESQLGDRIHQLVAWAVSNPGANLQKRCAALLEDFGIQDQAFFTALSCNLNAFIEHLHAKGLNSCHSELPINVVNPAGQEISGSIDLLVQLEDGWLIIDHKLFSGQSTETEYLENYAGQLLAYKEALKLAGMPAANMAIHAVTKGTLYRLAEHPV